MEQTQPGRMTIDQLLAKLDALHEAATAGEWEAGRTDMATVVDGFDSKWVYADDKYIIVASGRDCEEWSEVLANANFVRVDAAPGAAGWPTGVRVCAG